MINSFHNTTWSIYLTQCGKTKTICSKNPKKKIKSAISVDKVEKSFTGRTELKKASQKYHENRTEVQWVETVEARRRQSGLEGIGNVCGGKSP